MYIVLGLGINLIWGTMKVINFAHGDFVILGSSLTYWLFFLYGIDIHASIPMTFLVGFVIGWIYYKGILSRIKENELSTLIVTFSTSLIIGNSIKIFQGEFKMLRYPIEPLAFYNITIPVSRIVWLIVSVSLAVAFYIFLKETYVGKAIRAVAFDVDTSRLMGINTEFLYGLCCALGIGFALLAGTLYAFAYPFHPSSAGPLNLLAFVVVIVGGKGNYLGMIFGAIALGFTEVTIGYLWGPLFQLFAAFLLISIAIMIGRWRGGALSDRSVEV